MSVFHIVLIKWKPETSEEQIADQMAGMNALSGKIPGVERLHTGVNFSNRAKGYTHALVAQLADRAALEGYGPHPAHQALIPPFLAIAEDILAFDFEPGGD